ncbi:MAG: DUF6377 domain-containing protein [Bacteroidota bacterium]|nr:DUF6377 domain-containing protein [Bacteroidota bacterium]
MAFYCTASGQVNSGLADLNRAIDAAPKFDEAKLKAIDELKRSLTDIKQAPLSAQFDLYLQLFRQYQVFHYDSAFHYAQLLLETAGRLNEPARLSYARLKLAFCLLSAGMFKETFDSLSGIAVAGAPDSIKAEYYALAGRYYYDLADFDKDPYYAPDYNRKGNRYMDSALGLFPAGSFEEAYYKGLKELKTGNRDLAKAEFLALLKRPDLSLHSVAVTTSTLSDIYIHEKQADSAISLLIRAAIADIQSSTKETAAIFSLAQLLYEKNDIKNASSFIEAAVLNAEFYGARQRQVQVSTILPLIEGEKINRVENDKKTLIVYSVIATLLLLLVIMLTFIISRQVRKLKTAQRALVETNYKLSEANKIKEEYIGYFFNTNSEFFGKLEKFKKTLEQKMAYRKWEDIISVVNTINLKKEKEELLQTFDKAFLKLFPDFIAGFNALFRDEDRVQLKDNELLNTDLRIFALIRMGIHDTEKIARILEYSVNTINTYKTRIKNKSVVPNEAFEHRIMEIRTL